MKFGKIILAVFVFIWCIGEARAQVEVSEIRFVGNKAISSEEFVEDIKQKSGDGWKIFDERKYEYYVQKFSRSLAFSKGYFRMKIKRVTPQMVGGSYVVTVEVEEGRRFLLGEIKVSGAKAFSEKEIIGMLGQKTGDVADGRNLQDFVFEKLKRAYADKGYILYDAEFDPKFIEPEDENSDATVDVLITIDEDRQFKISRIILTGIEQEDARELKELLGFKEGEIFSQSKLEAGIKKLNELENLYFIDRDRDVEIKTRQEGESLDLFIKLTQIKIL